MKPSRPMFAFAALLALAALAAGCGGGSSSSSQSAAGSTAAEPGRASGESNRTLIGEADAICMATDEVTGKLQAEFKEAADPEARDYEAKLGELLGRIVVIGRTEGEELAALSPPKKEAATYRRWLTVGQEGLTDFEGAARALKKEGRSPKFARLYEGGQSKLTLANQIATGYGFQVCGGQRI